MLKLIICQVTGPSQWEVSWSNRSSVGQLCLWAEGEVRGIQSGLHVFATEAASHLQTHTTRGTVTLSIPSLPCGYLVGPTEKRLQTDMWFLCFWDWSLLSLLEVACLSLDLRYIGCSALSALVVSRKVRFSFKFIHLWLTFQFVVNKAYYSQFLFFSFDSNNDPGRLTE